MNRRYNPSMPPQTRPQRALEGWMVLAIVLGLVIGGAGLVAKSIIVPAFAKASQALEHPAGEAR